MNSGISVTFSEPMDPSILTSPSILTLAPSAGGTPITLIPMPDLLISPVQLAPRPRDVNFFPSVRLTENTSYTATVSTAAKDAAGNAMTVEHSWNFTTADTPDVWGSPQLVGSGDAGDAFFPQIAVDANGNAIAVWSQSDGAPGLGSRYNIWANRFNTASGTWDTAQLIGTGDGSLFGPQVALDPSGNAIAVWTQSAGMRSDIWANRFSAASGTWGTAQLIETDDLGNATGPQIAFDASGNAIAVWMQSDGTRQNIWANLFGAASGTWGTPQLIEADNAGSAVFPQIALDASGNAIAVWERFAGTHADLLANRFSAASGTWGTAQLIGNTAGFATRAQISLDASGNAIAVWEQVAAGRSDIWANRFSAASGTWGTAQLIENDNAGSASFPQIALDATGNAIAVWRQFTGLTADIWANRFSAASGSWGTAQLIDTEPGHASAPQIAFDPSGNAVVVWEQFDAIGISSIWARRFSAASSTWGGALLLATDASGPQLAIDTGGNAIAIWSQRDGARYNIWASHFR